MKLFADHERILKLWRRHKIRRGYFDWCNLLVEVRRLTALALEAEANKKKGRGK
jgi:hypothetical protein